ncbi:MAG: hypothetical protein ACOZE5_14515 [Verrucomicrobiota bacterium]
MNAKTLHLPLAASLGLALLALAAPARLSAQSGDHVTRAEYEKLLREVQELKSRLGEAETARTEQQKEADATAEEFEQQLRATKSLITTVQPGSSRFLLAGYGYGAFESFKGEDSTFKSALAPIFLWRLNNKLLFEAEPEFELEGSETEVNLEYANLSYILNDHVTLKAGKFLTPFGIFTERLHAAWINKLPDAPLVFREEGGLVPISSTGFQASGNLPLGDTNLVYALYVSNGPRVNFGADEPEEVGLLHFDNNTDGNNNKAIGGRVGWRAFGGLELGYSFKNARVEVPDGTRDALLQAVDLTYVRDSETLRGVFDLRGEWVWSRVSRATYDPTGAAGFGPLSFDNRRRGGYLQAAYRPSKLGSEWAQNLEFVVRRDALLQPEGPPESTDERRWTLGVNYWLTSSTALKAAYDFGRRTEKGESAESYQGLRLQAVMGF